MDIFISGLLLILFCPALVSIAFLGALFQGRPIFFTQQRPGLHGKVFKIWKFRTMAPCPGSGPGEPTTWGKFLRKSSLDELPQLWNILKGEMSLVGPRPLLVEYLPLYSPKQARRHEVLPGMTGWAQIKGRDSIPWERKLEYDVWYVENQSLLLDIKILILTALDWFKLPSPGKVADVPIEPFKGNSESGTSVEKRTQKP